MSFEKVLFKKVKEVIPKCIVDVLGFLIGILIPEVHILFRAFKGN